MNYEQQPTTYDSQSHVSTEELADLPAAENSNTASHSVSTTLSNQLDQLSIDDLNFQVVGDSGQMT